MTKVLCINFDYCDKSREFHATVEDETGEREVTITAPEFLAYKGANRLTDLIAVEVEVNTDYSGMAAYDNYSLQTRYATLEQYINMHEASEIEAELAVIIDRREDRMEDRPVMQIADVFKSLQKTA